MEGSSGSQHGSQHRIINIIEMVAGIPDKPFSSVRVCSVPKVFSSARAECFTPRLVGLGPYHHPRANLTMTDTLKLAAAKRVLHRAFFKGFISDVRDDHFTLIEGSYHEEIRDGNVNKKSGETSDPKRSDGKSDGASDDDPKSDGVSDEKSDEFVYMLIVDGLFLLALLHHGTSGADWPFSNYVLTGEWLGMTLVNTAGEELTMDGVVSDIFMLENQIPTLALQHIIEVNFHEVDFPIQLNDLGSVMLEFCKAYSPLVHSSSAETIPQPNHHLLHLMYDLVANKSESQTSASLDLDSEHMSEPEKLLLGVAYLCLLPWIILWVLVYCVVFIGQLFLQFIPFVLGKFIPLLGTILHQPEVKIQTPLDFLSSVLDSSLYHAFTTKISFPIIILIDCFKPISSSRIIGEAVGTTRRLLKLKDTKISLEARIPSVTELHSCEIQFKPSEGDIYSIKFDEIKRELYLPPMKLDATSEVILRNLAVYESLIKNDSLNFSNYIEFMRALIQTPKDVRILVVDDNIIRTQLSADEVSKIFKNQIGKSTRRPTEQIRTLEEQLKKVKPKFDAVSNVSSIFKSFLRIAVIIVVLVIFLPLLVHALHEIFCATSFGNKSQSCVRHVVGDYGRNDYFISSM